jgi:predicted chitinase
MQMFQINTPQRIRHFVSQCAHESAGLQYMKELGDYNYFTKHYEWRDDLGNNSAGDGAKYAGVGPIQVTGKNNYIRVSERVKDPKVVELGQDYTAKHYAFVASGIWWEDNKMNALCDRPDVTVEKVSRMVNCGGNPNYEINGLSDRIQYYEKACQVI